jgi:hypothetical protein
MDSNACVVTHVRVVSSWDVLLALSAVWTVFLSWLEVPQKKRSMILVLYLQMQQHLGMFSLVYCVCVVTHSPTYIYTNSYSQVPCLGGHCTPTLHLSREPFPTENVFGKIQGPTCFGGCSELCCDFEFPISRFSSEDKVGDVARITKRRPRGGFAAMRELFSQNDVFTIEFTDKGLSPEDKALILGNQLLLDFMFFEGGENEMCGQTEDRKGCYILCCNWYCYGVLCPCKLVFKNQKQ